MDDILGRTIDAFRVILDAAEATDDDTELGRKARAIIQAHAHKRVADALARRKRELGATS
jgi:hypothetical protein